MWFHVSQNDNDLEEPITELRVPEREYYDVPPDEPILCVAPTVWQCVVAVSARKPTTLYIYRIDVADPIPAAEHDSRIKDSEQTGEHRITEGILADNDGTISTKFLGRLKITHNEIVCLKGATAQCGVTPNHAQEMRVVWEKDGDDWRLRNHGNTLEEDWDALSSSS